MKRLLFRWVEEGDSENLRNDWVKRRKLDATALRDSAQPITSTQFSEQMKQDRAKQKQIAAAPMKVPTTPTSKTKPASPSPDPKATEPKARPASKPNETNPTAKSVNTINANVSTAENDLKEDPKKQSFAAEKAMRSAIAALSTVWTQAVVVKENLNSAKDWAWIKSTEHYPPFADACEAVEQFKLEVPMVNKMILTDNFGHLTPCSVKVSGQWGAS